MILKPKKLKRGDLVGVVGPASPMIRKRLEAGRRYLEKRGFRVKLAEHIQDAHGYLAGRDRDRASDFNQMVQDPEVAAIFCTRGGYGTPRILPLIDYTALKQNPKIIVGYSDITALQLAILAQAGLVSFSGPMVAVEMGKGMLPFTESHFWKLLTAAGERISFVPQNSSLNIVKPGFTEGRLLGGCLSMLCSLLGTPYCPDFKDAILFLEDVGEEPYKIDRYLTQLKLAGVLQQISGLVFGQFVDCVPQGPGASLTLQQVLEDTVSDLCVPVLSDLPYGHVDAKYTLPIGVQALLDAHQGLLQLTEDAVVS
ncbi:MAG: LD-carboxypeptidase [bacterium]